MGNIIRFILGAPIAAFLTFALFVLMMALISGEWEAEEKIETAKFEINPQVEDIQVIRRETQVDEVRRVDTPPPPPQIERQTAATPTEPIATLTGEIPSFEAPKISLEAVQFSVSDRDAQPFLRPPPIFPSRFEQGNNSGHCQVKFDVSPEGSPFNIVNTYCTSSLLERATVRAVEKWKFQPKIVDGRPVAMRGVINKVTYRLADERGNILPEPKR